MNRFTVVFEGDLRALQRNPFKIKSEFGTVLAVSIGDALAELERLGSVVDALDGAIGLEIKEGRQCPFCGVPMYEGWCETSDDADRCRMFGRTRPTERS